MMIDETQAIKAKDIVDNPDAIYSLMRAYILLTDMSMNYTFSNMVDAINLLYDAGWVVDSSTMSSNYYAVLMRNTNYKRKND